MKILIIRTVPGELNAQKMTYNIQEVGLATALRKKGNICDIMWCSNDHKYREETIVSEGQEIKLFIVRSIDFLKNGWMKDVDHIFDQYDILQPCEYNQMYTRHLAKKYADKVVVYHGPYYHEFCKNYNRMAKAFDMFFVDRYRKQNTCFIVKSGLAKDYLNSKGIKNVHAVGVGLSATFLGNSTVEELPELEDIKKIDCLKLLYIGVIEPRRNSLFLLDVLKALVDKGVLFKLIMIGRYQNEAYKQTFLEHVEAIGLADYIYYIPRVEQKYLCQVYSNTDIFLLPTIYDIFGMVLLESMYFNMPTITTVNGGSNMMIEDSKNGYVIKNFDPSVWAEKIADLSEQTELRKTVGSAAHETIVNHFTWDKLADKFIRIYESKLKESSK